MKKVLLLVLLVIIVYQITYADQVVWQEDFESSPWTDKVWTCNVQPTYGTSCYPYPSGYSGWNGANGNWGEDDIQVVAAAGHNSGLGLRFNLEGSCWNCLSEPHLKKGNVAGYDHISIQFDFRTNIPNRIFPSYLKFIRFESYPGYIFSIGTSGSTTRFMITCDNNGYQRWDGFDLQTEMSSGTWYTIKIDMEQTTGIHRLYVNGVDKGTVTTPVCSAKPEVVFIGNWSDLPWYTGNMSQEQPEYYIDIDNIVLINIEGSCIEDSDCNDNNSCTTDNCISSSCTWTNNSNSCNDGNMCTDNDQCSNGTCTGTNNNSLSCDDGEYCTGTESCSSGACISSGNPCTLPQLCNEETDTCYTPTTTSVTTTVTTTTVPPSLKKYIAWYHGDGSQDSSVNAYIQAAFAQLAVYYGLGTSWTDIAEYVTDGNTSAGAASSSDTGIADGVLMSSYDVPAYYVLFVGGGGATSMGTALNTSGRGAIKTFLNAGGTYVGSCAGAFLGGLGGTRPYLDLWAGRPSLPDGSNSIWPETSDWDGLVDYDLSFNSFNSGFSDPLEDVQYNGGCTMESNIANTTYLASYISSSSDLNGLQAMILTTYGAKSVPVILSCAHTEGGIPYQGGDYSFFKKQIMYAIDWEPTEPIYGGSCEGIKLEGAKIE